MRPQRIAKRLPVIGGKVWCCQDKGLFVLEDGPAVLRTVAITHFGSGGLTIYDGVPDDNGTFAGYDKADPNSNGTEIFPHAATTLGSWMLDAGCHHGITVLSEGGTVGVPSIATFVWMPYARKEASPPGTTPSRTVVGARDQRTGQDVQDVYRPAAPGSLMRSAALTRNGIYRLARRDAELYSVLVTHAGTFGAVRCANAYGETLWTQLSAFTGSFVLGGEAEAGLLVELHDALGIAPAVNVNWREPDQARV